MLHPRRYLSWARDPTKSLGLTCLQYAMWTMAASQSTQFENLKESLYRDTRQLLKSLDLGEETSETMRVEYVQAGILLSLYEFKRGTSQRALITMGQVFRMVQLMRLYQVDSPACPDVRLQRGFEDPIETEELRRTFWVAYMIDNFVSISNSIPLTLNEQEVRVPWSMGSVTLTTFLRFIHVFLSPKPISRMVSQCPWASCLK